MANETATQPIHPDTSRPASYIQSPWIVRVNSSILFLAFISLIALVLRSPHHFTYDEPFFVNNVYLLHQYGPTTRFLNSLTGAAGPLYALLQAGCEPLSRLTPIGMRLVNVTSLVAITAILARCLKLMGQVNHLSAAALTIAVPMTWVVSGLALSEIPAILFVTASIYFQIRALEQIKAGRNSMTQFVLSGLSLGIAVWGRQPFLLLTGVPLILAFRERRARSGVTVLIGIVLAMSLPLFAVWHGPVPPSQRQILTGTSFSHGVISLGYMAVCLLLLAPYSFLQIPWKLLAALAIPTIAANATLKLTILFPVQSAVTRYLPNNTTELYGIACGSIVIAMAEAVLLLLVRSIITNRDNLTKLSNELGLLIVSISPFFIGHQYSSRYTAMALPYLTLVAVQDRKWTRTALISSTCGCMLGFASLYGYLAQAEGPTSSPLSQNRHTTYMFQIANHAATARER